MATSQEQAVLAHFAQLQTKSIYTRAVKPECRKSSMTKLSFDVAFGSHRRVEEQSWVHERIDGLPDRSRRWNTKTMRPALYAEHNRRTCLGQSARFHTLGRYPDAVESTAHDVSTVHQQVLTASFSERQGRPTDVDEDGSMKRKKREGYFE